MANTVDILGFPHAYELTPPTKRSCVLVFVHGWLLSREYWSPLIKHLSQDYQCLSYDLRGFGESNRATGKSRLSPQNGNTTQRPLGANGFPKTLSTASLNLLSPQPASQAEQGLESNTSTPANGNGSLASGRSLTDTVANDVSQGYTPADYARDLVALLDALDIDQTWLIGHSLGGSIALWASDQAPQRVQGVSCLNAGGGIYLKEEFEKFRTVGQQLIKFRPPWLCYLPFIDRMMNRMNVANPVDRKWGRQRVVDLVTAEAEAALGSLLTSTTEEEVHKLPRVVSRLKQPVYFIGGAKDDIMEPKYVNHLASFHSSFQCTGDNVIEIPDCGHMAMVERPDQVAGHIRDLLAKHAFDTSMNIAEK